MSFSEAKRLIEQLEQREAALRQAARRKDLVIEDLRGRLEHVPHVLVTGPRRVEAARALLAALGHGPASQHVDDEHEAIVRIENKYYSALLKVMVGHGQQTQGMQCVVVAVCDKTWHDWSFQVEDEQCESRLCWHMEGDASAELRLRCLDGAFEVVESVSSAEEKGGVERVVEALGVVKWEGLQMKGKAAAAAPAVTEEEEEEDLGALIEAIRNTSAGALGLPDEQRRARAFVMAQRLSRYLGLEEED